jgi:hypothetical protein
MIVGWEWLWNRTKRLADLLTEPRILAGAVQVVEHLDRFCDEHEIPESSVQLGEAKFIRGMTYVEYPLGRQ